MTSNGTCRLAAALCSALLLVAGAGCGNGNGYQRYVPAAERAQSALEAALDAWRSGQAPGVIEGDQATIQVVDSTRRPGQKLQSFEVLGPAAGDSPSCYGARLILEQPAEQQLGRFVVLGIEPIYVFRYEDYVMMEHWCDMPAQQASTTVIK
jgi:hypothetical protein